MTAFLSPAVKVEGQNWWSDVVGAAPQSRTVQQGLLYRDEGPAQGGYLTLNISPSRADWTWGPANEPSVIDFGVAQFDMGVWQDKSPVFEELMSNWLAQSPRLTRIGFGAVLRAYVDEPKDGYNILADYLPNIHIDIENSSDFFYQINRPRATTTETLDMKINRISQWSAVIIEELQANTYGGFGAPVRFHAARLGLDLSTSIGYEGELPQEHLTSLFREAVALAAEIIVNGDVP